MTKQLINFITDTNDPPTASDPPPLIMRNVNLYDTILKSMGESLYLLSADIGSFGHNDDGTSFGAYSIQEYNDSLGLLNESPINVSAIPCNTLDGYCKITDYDVDSQGNILLAVQLIDTFTSTSIYKLSKKDGSLQVSIDRPCSNDGADSSGTVAGIHVTIACNDWIIVSCPNPNDVQPATTVIGKSLTLKC